MVCAIATIASFSVQPRTHIWLCHPHALRLLSAHPTERHLALGVCANRFLLGLGVDMFTNTPGMAAGAMCLLGLVTPWLLKMFAPNDGNDVFEPSRKVMEWSSFVKYTLFSVLVYCLAFFMLEAFSFFDWQILLINILGSTLLTTLFVIAMEAIRSK